MAIKQGERVPDIKVIEMRDGQPAPTSLAELSAGRRVVVFAVPGAFTPTCTAKHLPGYVDRAAELRAKGIGEVVCLAVNDAFVMDAWGRQAGAAGKVRMLGDGNGELTRALGLTMDGSKFGLGERSQRYAMVIRDGLVESLMVEPGPGLSVSSAESVLGAL